MHCFTELNAYWLKKKKKATGLIVLLSNVFSNIADFKRTHLHVNEIFRISCAWTKSKVYLQPLIKPLKYHFFSPWKSFSLPSYIICSTASTCIVFQAQRGNSHSENFMQAKTSLQCRREILLSQSVTLSTNINVNSNNSLQAEAFTLIIFEYVTVCFIRLYLLVPQNEFFGVFFPRWLYIMLHSCCRELTVENTLE